jgi:hypothetical protein
MGGAGGAVLLVLAGLALWAALTPAPPPRKVPTQPTLIVTNSGKAGTFPTIRKALTQARSGKPGLGARILVQSPIQEEVMVDLANISIEADSSQPVVWKAPTNALPASKLVLVNKAADFHLKGFLLDGDNRLDSLVVLFDHCPGTTLEDLTFQNFKHSGCHVTNCAGGAAPDRHLFLLDLTFVTTRPDQAGIFLTISDRIPDLLKNRYITVRNPQLKGPGARIKTPQLSFNEDCELPEPVTIGK